MLVPTGSLPSHYLGCSFPRKEMEIPPGKSWVHSHCLQKFVQDKASLPTPCMGRKCHQLGKQDRATAKTHLHQAQKGLEYL